MTQKIEATVLPVATELLKIAAVYLDDMGTEKQRRRLMLESDLSTIDAPPKTQAAIAMCRHNFCPATAFIVEHRIDPEASAYLRAALKEWLPHVLHLVKTQP